MERNNGTFGTIFVNNTGNSEQITERFFPQVCQVTVTSNDKGEPIQYVFQTNILGGNPSVTSLTVSLRKETDSLTIRAWFGNHTYLDFTEIIEEEYKVLEQKIWEFNNPDVEFDLDSLMDLLRISNRKEYLELLTKYDEICARTLEPQQKKLKLK